MRRFSGPDARLSARFRLATLIAVFALLPSLASGGEVEEVGSALRHLSADERELWAAAERCLVPTRADVLVLVVATPECRPCRELGRRLRESGAFGSDAAVVFAWRGAASCGEASLLASRAGSFDSTWLPLRSALGDARVSPQVFVYREGVLRWSHRGAPTFATLRAALDAASGGGGGE